MEGIYMDAAATTPARPEVIEAVQNMLGQNFGNPSSLHAPGVNAEKEIKKARRRVAESIGAEPGQVIFTSGGTEANNLAIRSLIRPGGHCISSTIEHPSVQEAFRHLARQDCAVDYCRVDREGNIDIQHLEQILDPSTCFLSLSLANNEIGTVQALDEIVRVARKKASRLLIHTDAVQAWGKLHLDWEQLGVDALTISAHKTGGPKGAGALFIRRPELIKPLLWGGWQEEGLRSGTENTPGIVGMGVAATLLPEEKKLRALTQIKKDFFKQIRERISGVKLIGPSPDKSVPHILNLSFPGLPAQVLVQALSREGIYVSSGSACSSRGGQISYVLQALGLKKEIALSAVRFGFLDDITSSEAAEAAEKLVQVVNQLKKVMGNV